MVSPDGDDEAARLVHRFSLDGVSRIRRHDIQNVLAIGEQATTHDEDGHTFEQRQNVLHDSTPSG